ncbi:MAG: N-acetylmuramoyl-L-alanine amidase [Proteobacteria bacterium]|nr:N-acetylmuramoyl-L-alanine amidase [Pseudomonadota bacterium]
MLFFRKINKLKKLILLWLAFSLVVFVTSIEESFCADKQNSDTSNFNKVLDIEFSKEQKLSIKLNRKTDYKIFTLSNPNRVAIEIKNTKVSDKLSTPKPDYVSKITFDKNSDKLTIYIFFDEKFITKNTFFDAKQNLITTELIQKNPKINIDSNEPDQPNKDSKPKNSVIEELKKPSPTTSKTKTTSNKNIKKIDDILDQIPPDDEDKNNAKNVGESDAENEKTFDPKIIPSDKSPKSQENNNQDLVVKKTHNSIVKYKIRQPNDKSVNYLAKINPKKISSNSETSITQIPQKPVIVIDAGHGGKDPGTIGLFARTKEKNLTLSYAKELAKHLAKEKKYKIYLTRDDDFFIPLDKRVAKSRKKKADLFISLHANSIVDKNVSGFSIYTLSETSSDKQAEVLAQKENQADIINGIDFSGASKDIMKTLIDLSQRESKNSSARLAKFIIKEVKKADIEILQNTHRFAGFMVLTAPDMASVLIELGYLSNKTEEKMLNSLSYRRLVSKTLASGIDQYFNNYK